MKKIILAFLFCCIGFNGFSQIEPKRKKLRVDQGNEFSRDSVTDRFKDRSNKVKKNKEAKITDYLIISHLRDTTYLDTTLTINKEYKYNYLRKDNFNLMPFSNLGQTYNTLSRNFENNDLIPRFGARARHFNFMEVEDIDYYHVPTPTTELFFKTAFQQGQLLDAFFTVNTSERLNLSIGYKGLRSLGVYQNILTSTGNFRLISSYKTKNKRYVANLHFVSQDLLNRENGGLKDDNLIFFEERDEDFNDRGVFEVNFQDAESTLFGKRFYLNHSYAIVQKKDSLSNNTLDVTHIMNFDDKRYQYQQATAANDFFGEAFQNSGLRDKVTLENFYNQVQLNYSNNIIGNVQFNASHTNYNYGYDRIVNLNGGIIPNRLKGDVVAVGGKYKKQVGGFMLKGDLGVNISGNLEGNYIKGQASYQLNEDAMVSAQISHNSVAPNYNTILYQSDYVNYNWNNKDFTNIETQQLSFNLKSNKWANVSVDLSTINDHVYFAKDETDEGTKTVKPFQNKDKVITYLRAKVNKEIRYRNLALDNTIMYQNVQDENKVFNVPEIITRNTLYYSNHVFKKAMYLQTGITFNYFTKYNMNGYDPLLAEFYTQNDSDKVLGSFPRLDFFLNAKIRQTRIYFKAEHFNTLFAKENKYYSAPNHPYRDFTIRFGLVWNFFL